MAFLPIKVDYDYLIIFDGDFLSWLRDLQGSEAIIRKLMYINNSALNRQRQIFMLHSQTGDISNLKDYLKGSCTVVEDHESIKEINDNITKNIFFAIDCAGCNKPYRAYIFTTQKNYEKYVENEHCKQVKSITIKAEKDAINIIDRYFMQFTIRKENARSGIN